MIRLERGFEEKEYFARVTAAVPNGIVEYDLHKQGPKDHVKICDDMYGKKATEFFAKQLGLSTNYYLNQPVVTDRNTMEIRVVEMGTSKSRVLVYEPQESSAEFERLSTLDLRNIEETKEFVLSAKFRCSCHSDVSQGVPCRHILRMLQEYSLGFAARVPYFHERWEKNKTIPTNLMKTILNAPSISDHSMPQSESAIDVFDDRGDSPDVETRGGDAGDDDDDDDDEGGAEAMLKKFMHETRNPGTCNIGAIHVEHVQDPNARRKASINLYEGITNL